MPKLVLVSARREERIAAKTRAHAHRSESRMQRTALMPAQAPVVTIKVSPGSFEVRVTLGEGGQLMAKKRIRPAAEGKATMSTEDRMEYYRSAMERHSPSEPS